MSRLNLYPEDFEKYYTWVEICEVLGCPPQIESVTILFDLDDVVYTEPKEQE